MNSEGYEILREIHREEWLEYVEAQMQSILDARVQTLFEFFATDRQACLDAVNSAIPFQEWFIQFSKIQSGGTKRL